MAFPISNYTRVWVRGRIVDLAKAAREESSYGVTGPIQFIPSPDVVVDNGTDQIIDMKPFVVFPAASDGYFEIQLPATNDPDINPVGWTYHVIEPTGRDYHIQVPYDLPVVTNVSDPKYGLQVLELSDVVPDPESKAGFVQLISGAAGRGIATMTVAANGHLTGTYTDGVSWDAGLFPVVSVAGKQGVITLVKGDVGLGNVDNTSDASKPVSTAQNTAINTAVSNHAAAADPHPVYLTSAEGDAAYAALIHNHAASAINSGQLASARMPQVLSPVRAVTGATGTITPDASVAGNNLNYTATGNITFAAPTGAADRQALKIAVLASGADRTVSFDTAIRASTGITRGPHTVTSGQVLICGLEYSTLINAWVLIGLTISAS